MRRRERGEYQGVYTALFDGPDFLALDADSRWLLIAMRLKLGATSIQAVPALLAVLAHWTALAPERVEAALERLKYDGWVEIDGSVAWVVRGLLFSTGLDVATPNHRRYVQRHLASLPRLAIVDRFRVRYAEWLDGAAPLDPLGEGRRTPSDPFRGGSEPHPDPIGGGSRAHPHDVDVYRRPQTANEESSPAGAFGENWVAKAVKLWAESKGDVSHGRMGKTCKPIVDEIGEKRFLGMLWCLLQLPAEAKYLSIPRLGTHWREYFAKVSPLDDEGNIIPIRADGTTHPLAALFFAGAV